MKTQAIVYVDGKEFIRCPTKEDGNETFEQTRQEYPDSEIALMVWKPRHKIWLREKLSC